MGIDMRKRLFQRKRLKCPVGLLDRVIKILEDEGINYDIKDSREVPEKYNYFVYKNKMPELYKHQKEALEEIKKRPLNAISVATGAGKTFILIKTAVEWGVNTLIIVPTLNLLNQITDEFSYYLGRENVGGCDDKKLKPIVVANVQALQNMDESFWKHFDAIQLDESHHTSCVSYYDLNKKFWKHITYRLFVSATQFRCDGADMKLEGLIGNVTYEYSARQAVLDGIIVRPYFLIYQIQHFADTGDWPSTYLQNIVENVNRNKKIITIANKLINNSSKNILILVNRIEHANILHDEIPNSVLVTGENKTKDNKKLIEEYRLNNIRCCIATSQIFSEGIDLKNVEVLILAGGYSSEILILQSTGRAVRTCAQINKKCCMIIDFYDKGSRILERHSKERERIYRNYYFPENIKKIK
jgi:superfamily II DNA or RNA helicase